MTDIYSKVKVLDVKPIINHYMDQLCLGELFEKYIPKTDKMELAPAEVLKMMIFNIINAPSPLYKVSEWATSYFDGMGEDPNEAAKYNDDCLSRKLDLLYQCDRNEMMVELTDNAIHAHQLETDKLHNDTTSITFQGRYENQDPNAAQLKYGHNKDGHPDCLQLVYGLNITEDGNVPLTFELFNGNQSDDTTHVPNWEQLREMLDKTDFVYVADCKLCSSENLDHIDQNKGKFITVVPKKRAMLKPFYQQLENNEVQWEYAYSVPDNRKPSEKHDFFTFESGLTDKGYRLVWILSTAKAHQDYKTRERRLEKAEASLADIAQGLNRYSLKTRKQIENAIKKATQNTKGLFDTELIEHENRTRKKVGAGRPGPDSVYEDQITITYELKWERNQDAIDKQALADGTFPLITNTDLECAEVLRTYKQQPCLEKRFSTAKSVLEIAPVFLEKSSRIEAMMFLYFVALMVISLVERSVRKQMEEKSIDKLPILPQKMKTGSPTWNNLQYLFRNVHLSQIFVKDKLVNQTIKGLQAIHLEVLRLLKVPASLYTNHSCQV